MNRTTNYFLIYVINKKWFAPWLVQKNIVLINELMNTLLSVALTSATSVKTLNALFTFEVHPACQDRTPMVWLRWNAFAPLMQATTSKWWTRQDSSTRSLIQMSFDCLRSVSWTCILKVLHHRSMQSFGGTIARSHLIVWSVCSCRSV